MLEAEARKIRDWPLNSRCACIQVVLCVFCVCVCFALFYDSDDARRTKAYSDNLMYVSCHTPD